MGCETFFNKARNYTIGATATFLPSYIGLAIAMGLNAGFFTAPGAVAAMVAVGVLIATSFGLLIKANEQLSFFVSCGGLSPQCEGKLDDLKNMLAGTISTLMALAASAFGIAVFGWIPYFAQGPMWALYASLSLGTVALAALQIMFIPVEQCQSSVASSRGRLQDGEKASDPWFLRLQPTFEPEYKIPSNSDVINQDAVDDKWLRCALLNISDWEIKATALIAAAYQNPQITFTWTLNGVEIPQNAANSDNEKSILSYQFPSQEENLTLRVKARDQNGFTQTKEVLLENLEPAQFTCVFKFPLLPVKAKSLVYPKIWDKFKPVLDNYFKELDLEKVSQIREKVK